MRTIENTSESMLYREAADLLRLGVSEACRSKGRYTIGIVGGKSATAVIECLAKDDFECAGEIDVFWLDERLELDAKNWRSTERALRQIRKTGVAIRWYPFFAQDILAITAEARIIEQRLEDLRGTAHFDLVLCSAGEDGHVASLFPHHPALAKTATAFVLEDSAPKPPPVRITATPRLLASARSAFLFFVGPKREAYDLFSSSVPVAVCPAKILLDVADLTVFKSLREA